MRVQAFVQPNGGATTLKRIVRLTNLVDPTDALFAFAYATVSGCAEFERKLGDRYWNASAKWLVGIDYGRTEPRALQYLLDRLPAANVRVHNGHAVSAAPAFWPTRDFHLKGCCVTNAAAHSSGLLVGSGNFSRAGLVRNEEMGALIVAQSQDEDTRVVEPVRARLTALFAAADPAQAILPNYSALWVPSYAKKEPAQPVAPVQPGWGRFWIDVGYVTKNRGPNSPGNQIDMPRGVHRFFGLVEPQNIQPNTTIGDVDFLGLAAPLSRALRLGNNMMEKITLPIPETNGFGAYDGKILEFERGAGGFFLRTYEPGDFGDILSASPQRVSHEMGSHRRYGFRNT